MLPTRTSSLDFLDALAVDADMARRRSTACARVRLFTSRMQRRKRSILTFFLSFASSAKAWERARWRVVARGAAAAPAPGVAGPGEADLVHQPRDRLLDEADRGRELASTGSSPPAERTLRAWLASRSARSMRIQSRPSAAVGERGAARVGFGVRASPRPAGGSAGIGWLVRTASKRRAPVLRGGLEQRSERRRRADRGGREAGAAPGGRPARDARWR